LQRQDGSFVGVAFVGDQWANFYDLVPYMVAFDASGAVLWSVPNEEPQIATADGGVIGKSGITYDQNGRYATSVKPLTAQMAEIGSHFLTAVRLTYSWTLDTAQAPPTVQALRCYARLGPRSSPAT
jgi:hypothetical protein